jgi:hypothetical protein
VDLGIPPSQFTGRPTVTTTVIVDGVTRTTTASPWTPEDQSLMLAWREYQDGLCDGCGHPKETAWHHLSEDTFEMTGEFVCWACTAANPVDEKGHHELKKFPVVEDTRDYTRFPLPGPAQPLVPE